MAENDQSNDEYKLDDLDLLATEPQTPTEEEEVPNESGRTTFAAFQQVEDRFPFLKNPTVRNGIIAIGCVFLIIMCYKIILSFYDEPISKSEIKAVEPTVQTQKKLTTVEPSTVFTQSAPIEKDKNLSSIEKQMETMTNSVAGINAQLSSMTTTLTDISNKLADLNNSMLALNQKIDLQSRAIEQLMMAKTKPPVMSRPKMTRPAVHAYRESVEYYLQAIIPGRAWLITSAGTSTLTVREGTPIPGYGVVRLIDPKQGRVLTSSGRVIRFSQADS